MIPEAPPPFKECSAAYAGPESVEATANVIAKAAGPSGPNDEPPGFAFLSRLSSLEWVLGFICLICWVSLLVFSVL